jgi:hypothetical protein
MGRGNHHSIASIARQAGKHLDYHAEHDSVVKPPIKVKTIQAVRWTKLTPNLDKPFKRNSRVKAKSKYAWRNQTYPGIKLIA